MSLGFRVRGFDLLGVDDPIDDVEYLTGDITDSHVLSDITRDIDFVFHLLEIKHEDNNTGKRRGKINLVTTLKLANLAKSLGVKAFVYHSGASVYGKPDEGLIPESAKRRPITRRGKEHLLVEDYLTETMAPRGMAVIILRTAPLIGWGTKRELFPSLYSTLKRASSGRPIFLIARGRYPVQFVDVEDVASAMVRAIRLVDDEPVMGSSLILNVAARDIMTQNDLAEFMLDFLESPSVTVNIPAITLPLTGLMRRLGIPPLGTDDHHLFKPQTIIDPLKAIELLDHTPKKITESLSETFNSWSEEDLFGEKGEEGFGGSGLLDGFKRRR